MSLRCGRIAYTNDLPIYAAFDAGAIEYPGTLHSDVPSALNAMLKDGELDAGPISAFAYGLEPERYVLLPDLCIGARDEVLSVLLASPTPPALLSGAKVAVTHESASGRALLRVLLEGRYGVRAQYLDEADPPARAAAGDPTLLIGDAAIDALHTLDHANLYDLGSLWHEWTGEQAVFAVWVARRDAFERAPDAVRACLYALTDAYTWGRSHMSEVIGFANARRPRPAGFYERYYGKLNFTFHTAAQRGLTAFFEQLAAIGALAHVPPVNPEAYLAAR